MTPTLPILRVMLCGYKTISPNHFYGQELSVPIWLAGNIVQVFLRHSVWVADQIWMTSNWLYAISKILFLLQ